MQKLINGLNPSKKQSFLEVIRDFINWLKGKFTKSADKQMQLDIERFENMFNKIYAEAQQQFENGNTPTEEAGVRYSLNEFEDGQRFVDVKTDQKLFVGKTLKEKIDIATNLLKKRFQGKVIGIDNRAFVNGVTIDEFVHPAKHISDTSIYEAKLQASTELDNLIDAGFNFRNDLDGKDGHTHPDAVGGFDYFDVIFKVGNEYFQGLINIKNNNRGKLLTDITQIKNITNDMTSRYGESPSYAFIRDVSTTNIPSTEENVNTQNSIPDNKADAEYMSAVENGDMAAAQREVENINLKGQNLYMLIIQNQCFV